jgi:hypothetical protein
MVKIEEKFCFQLTFLSRDEEDQYAGLKKRIRSPDSSNISRSTPCAAGCCGPKLRLKVLRDFVVVYDFIKTL